MTLDKANKQQPVANAEPTAPAEKFNLVTYLQDVRVELGKVMWPSRQQVISESAAVFLMVLVSTLFIFLIDSLFHSIAKLVF